MEKSFGQRFSEKRRERGLTQEQVAEKLSVSAQAVSKWENDISMPDISLLSDIAKLFDTTIDALLNDEERKPEASYIPPEKRKDINDMLLKIVVNSQKGDKVRVNLPMSIIVACVGTDGNFVFAEGNPALKGIDFKKIISLVEQGALGKLVEVESAEGDIVEIYVE